MSSFPSMHASDCMNVSMSSRYLWGKFPLPWRLVNKRCPNFHSDFMATTVKYAAAGGDVYAAAAVVANMLIHAHIDVDLDLMVMFMLILLFILLLILMLILILMLMVMMILMLMLLLMITDDH